MILSVFQTLVRKERVTLTTAAILQRVDCHRESCRVLLDTRAPTASPAAFAHDQVDDIQHQLLVVCLAMTFLRESRVGVVLLEEEALGRGGAAPGCLFLCWFGML